MFFLNFKLGDRLGETDRRIARCGPQYGRILKLNNIIFSLFRNFFAYNSALYPSWVSRWASACLNGVKSGAHSPAVSDGMQNFAQTSM